jgi:ppGpp synthetase/RelA/SpoT-type nucleotidyltranferase
MIEADIEKLIDSYKRNRKAYSGFMNNVIDFFKSDNDGLLDPKGRFVVHSIKFREKAVSHIEDKRKSTETPPLNEENFFQRINDFCGVRVLHLRLSEFELIHSAILGHISAQFWAFAEPPKAYTWDPEYKSFFEKLGVQTEIKESVYTSVHYVVKPNQDNFVCCEIQVRTLFEEIWGEIDHDLNYPVRSEFISCQEQLKVLAKLVGAGTKLVDSIYSSIPTDRQKSKATP